MFIDFLGANTLGILCGHLVIKFLNSRSVCVGWRPQLTVCSSLGWTRILKSPILQCLFVGCTATSSCLPTLSNTHPHACRSSFVRHRHCRRRCFAQVLIVSMRCYPAHVRSAKRRLRKVVDSLMPFSWFVCQDHFS